MKIPREFESHLFKYILSEVRNPDGPRTPAALGESCAAFTRRWFGIEELPAEFKWAEGLELLAWSARLGKHVGEFFLNHKEV